MSEGRDHHGRFARGCAGGPGRPSRPVEADYLKALSDSCSIEAWQRIIKRSVEDAEAGDPKAREFLAKYLLGDNHPTLARIAAAEKRGVDAAADSVASEIADAELSDQLMESLRKHSS